MHGPPTTRHRSRLRATHLVYLNHEGYVVKLQQRGLIDTATGRQTHREPAQVFITHNGEHVLNAAIKHPSGLRDAINRAIALA